MVTVAKRPTGHKIIDQAITATIGEAYGGDALVTFPSHGLSTGDTVYITSDLEDYNGFWYVTISDTNTFKISEHASADFVEYFQDADIEYYQTQEHVWSSIFLPIIYKCTNDRWPVNSVDSAALIVLNSDDNGFTQLTLAGPLKANVQALEFLTIAGASTDSANGVWQIVEVVLSNVLVINLPYELSGSLIGATAQYYYNNYQVRVKVFGGLPALHPWAHKKPWEEVAELSLTPDDNNEVMFSVADYLQGKVAIKNNPLLFSMPLNLDAFTGFYISTGESYDYSDGYALGTAESSFTIDEFEGFAIAGKLPFKNVYAGDYADYILTSGSPALWLTNRERLLAVEGYYFDVSFIKNIRGDFQIIISKTVGDYSITETVDYDDQGEGVYRIPITPDANYDSFCIYANVLPTGGSGGDIVPVNDFPGLEEFADLGTGTVWTTGIAEPFTELDDSLSLQLTSPAYDFAVGTTYRVTVGYEIDRGIFPPAEPNHTIWLRATETFSTIPFAEDSDQTDGITSGTLMIEFTPVSLSPLINRIRVQAEDSSMVTVTVVSILVEYITPVIPPTSGGIATEEICIDMLEVCEIENGFITDTSRRLTEDGGFRLLE